MARTCSLQRQHTWDTVNGKGFFASSWTIVTMIWKMSNGRRLIGASVTDLSLGGLSGPKAASVPAVSVGMARFGALELMDLPLAV